MKITSPLTYGIAIFLVIELTAFRVARCFSDFHEFDRRCMALYKVTNYLVRRPRQMNVDGLFGITLAEANLLAALHHPNAKLLAPRYRELIAKVLQSFERTRVLIKNGVQSENRDVALINAVLNEPTLWLRSIVWKRDSLGTRPEPTPGLNRTQAETMLYRGTPQESESDRCIGELIRKTLAGRCRVSGDCGDTLTRRDDSAGYPLSHRLLYVQIARALKCREPRDLPFEKLINAYCAAILQNLVDAEASMFPGASRDLAIEQALLCGMEGFEDFANNHYAATIRGWMHPAGCYNSRGFVDHRNDSLNSYFGTSIFTRRSAGPMDFGCDNHATGLAAGALAMFVRESVENSFQRIIDKTYE